MFENVNFEMEFSKPRSRLETSVYGQSWRNTILTLKKEGGIMLTLSFLKTCTCQGQSFSTAAYQTLMFLNVCGLPSKGIKWA